MAEDEVQPSTEPPRLGLVGKLRAWSAGHPIRNTLIGVALAAASVATITAWLALTRIATAPDGYTVERALEQLDAGEDDAARAIIDRLMEGDSLKASDYGAALYVMGIIKVREAERQWSPERSRNDYYIASKYLDEARTFSFPDGREADALLQLGKSFLESRQLEKGTETLRQALDAGMRGKAKAHLLLAEAYFYAPEPDFKQAIAEADIALADPLIDPIQLTSAQLLRSEAFASLGLGDKALAAAQETDATVDPARRSLAEGRARVAKLQSAAPGERAALAEAADSVLEQARRADQLSTSISRESDYLKAQIAELLGFREKAILEYGELRRSHGTSEAGIAAAFAEGDLLQNEGNDDEALEAYRRALDAIDDPASYRSRLLPLQAAKQRALSAHQRLLERNRYNAALQMTDWVGDLLGPTQQLLLRADTLQRWGEALIAEGESEGVKGRQKVRKGRKRLREAGGAYERLAEARFATNDFIEDLWASAELYQRGQSFTEAIRVLDRYLRNEPVKRNALALLRLGEAQLARGQDDAAVATLQECLEFHENDASSYRARLICAQAHRMRTDYAQAEAYLRHNLSRTALGTEAPEWRDSKFELGHLLAEAKRNDEAIAELEEAVARYPDDPQTRWARYQIALSHRQAAREPLSRLRAAQTVNEREQARQEAYEHLEAALAMFQSVQREITMADTADPLDRATLRNCYMLGGNVLFELERYEDARQSFASVSTLYQNEPYMLEALVHIYYCWRRQDDRPKAMGVVQQAQQLLKRLPDDADFATSTNMNRAQWASLLTTLEQI
ncbi:tetratricopeptide repeat protein [Botrimarina mediterranea]|uniref:tetratricopeptide repeat protein n=1 Tax=Botrimarina mediterranea TaxID=2528022 RepID=UPI00118B468E|nr:Outer membrane protein assembly factor BamD [Planctomycetes bacterium K2D]